MCSAPDVPNAPERQAARSPSGDIGARMSDRDRRRRGYGAAMIAPMSGAAATTNVLGV